MKFVGVYLPARDIDIRMITGFYEQLGGQVVWQGAKMAIVTWPNTDCQLMLTTDSLGSRPAGLMFEENE